MPAPRLFEGVPVAVAAVPPLAGSALLRYVGRHRDLPPAEVPALWPALQSGVRMYESREPAQPSMTNSAASPLSANSQDMYRVRFSSVSLRRWLLMLRSMGKPQLSCQATLVARERSTTCGLMLVMASQSASAFVTGNGVMANDSPSA